MLAVANMFDCFFFFPHLIHRIWSLMLKETLKYWHQNWITDVINQRITWTGHAGAACQVNGWMCRCVSVEYLFLAKCISYMYASEKQRNLFCQILCCLKARGTLYLCLPWRWSKGLRKGLGTWASSPCLWPLRAVLGGARPDSCSPPPQPSPPGAWRGLP